MKYALSLSGMEKLLKKAGAERVSDRAKSAFREVLEDFGEQIGKKAVMFANHSKRKTIKSEDIKLANKS
ncbi:NFYB/HAP3 family transcription factor subunit [Candidatus Woesearchaeota archaeon]|nr:NFYB/HAP3 family transcription factor subunit [Candidatus Woesearchaeota archaeon]